MAFAALDQFAAIGAVLLAGAARLDRLAIDAARRWGGFAPRCHSHLLAQHLDDPGPSVVVPPAFEGVIDCSPRREVPRQHPPRTAGTVKVEDSIDYLAQVRLAWPTVLGRAREKGFQQRPLLVRQVAR